MSMKDDVDGYLQTVARLEPDVHPIDASAFYASAAISLKRMADYQRAALELGVRRYNREYSTNLEMQDLVKVTGGGG